MNQNYLLPLVLLVAALSACTGSRQDRWLPEPELMAPAVRAMQDWCVATDGHYCPQLARDGNPMRIADEPGHDDECGWIHLRGEGRDTEPQWLTVSRSNLDGCSDGYGGTGLVGLLRHELGHAIGLPDLDDPTRVMYRYSGTPGVITDADVVEAAAINGW